jgi:heat shock protein HtpX
MSSWVIIFIIVAFFVASLFSAISYFFSKSMVKWLKGVERIDNRKDLGGLPGSVGFKLKEIVRMVRTISQNYQIRMPEVGIYASKEINAFATGPVNDTLIAFSSNLVNTMSMEEISGVIGHELSHLINYDLRRILLVQGIFDTFYWLFSFLLFWAVFRPQRDEEQKEDHGEFISWIFKFVFFQMVANIMRLLGILIIFWYNRKRELDADLQGAKIVGLDNMLKTLRKLLYLENKDWIVDGIDLTEDEIIQQGEPNSVSLLKFNPENKKRGFLDLFRTHPPLEERIKRLEKLRKRKPGISNH